MDKEYSLWTNEDFDALNNALRTFESVGQELEKEIPVYYKALAIYMPGYGVYLTTTQLMKNEVLSKEAYKDFEKECIKLAVSDFVYDDENLTENLEYSIDGNVIVMKDFDEDEAASLKEDGELSSKLSQIIIRLYDVILKYSVLLIDDGSNYYCAFSDMQKKLKETRNILLKDCGIY